MKGQTNEQTNVPSYQATNEKAIDLTKNEWMHGVEWNGMNGILLHVFNKGLAATLLSHITEILQTVYITFGSDITLVQNRWIMTARLGWYLTE